VLKARSVEPQTIMLLLSASAIAKDCKCDLLAMLRVLIISLAATGGLNSYR